MPDDALLDQLCTRCGIAIEYYDLWGQRHLARRETKLALLQSMGIAIAHADDARAALAGLDEREWRELLPPVKVVRERETPIRIVLTLPIARASTAVDWLLVLESGEHTHGQLRPEALQLLATRDIAGRAHGRYAFDLSPPPIAGYHVFSLLDPDQPQQALASTQLIVCPDQCYEPPALAGSGRIWGPAIQLYAVRSRRNWGIGDFGDLKELTEMASRMGAGMVGVNPLHALFPHRPEGASPYSPSNRLALNVLYLEVEAIDDFTECIEAQRRVRAPEFQARLQELRDRELIDYAGVADAKFEILGILYSHFRDRHLAQVTRRAQAFRAFQAAGGEPLRLHAAFEALQDFFFRQDRSAWGWPAWPAQYRDPRSEAVEAFCREHVERLEYFQYLQWQADLQLSAIGSRSASLGLPVGLYRDLAVGASPGGAETWMNRSLHALAAHIGAPPDDFNLRGQDWGLPPCIPAQLPALRYAHFIAILRVNMRHAGALRIDHVMGLMRLFWIPSAAGARDGTYVAYPFEDLLAIVALESRRNRCLVIGEDLGTVPDAVRAAMTSFGILSYRPLYFQRTGDAEFIEPERYPDQALVTISTHDLPTLRGFWLGTDLATHEALEMYPDKEVRARQAAERSRDRIRLSRALERAGLIPGGTSASPPADMNDHLVQAVHAFLARTPAKIQAVQLEDVFGQTEQVNLPSTVDEIYPNWRRKLALNLEDWPGDARMETLIAMLRRERGFEPASRPAGGGHRKLSRRRTAIPLATYRLQFNREFTFAKATELVPYLATLGITHIYASPYLKARPGSAHGYDIVDHNALNPEIGGEEDFDRFVTALHEFGMGQMLDMVPNHMGVMEADNDWWLDVLENGPASPYAAYFDIDWEPPSDELRGKILVPVLGDQYGAVLESGALKLEFEVRSGSFGIRCHKHRFPVDPREYPRILGMGLDRLAGRFPAHEQLLLEFQKLVTAFGCLPRRDEVSPEKVGARVRDKEFHKRQLAELCTRSPEIARFIEGNVRAVNGVPGDPQSFDRLHELIKAQSFRLAYWRVAADDINYRRFFDVNGLAALRMENDRVFEDTHRLVLRLLAEQKIDALRIDHPDGLYDPRRYFEQLQSRVESHESAARDGLADPPPRRNVYLVIEKILAEHERLPETWAVHGTTGYRFANLVNGLFVDGTAEARMSRIYASFIGRRMDFDELLRNSKTLIMITALSSELNVLANALNRIAKANRHTCDFTLGSLRRALVEIVACFPVYRTYETASGARGDAGRYIEWAVAVAKKRSPAAETSIFDFIRDVLSGAAPGKDAGYLDMVESFIGRFQQFTAPVMAKGMEDTSFYVFNRLASLNEVGGDPRTFGISLNAFHTASLDRARTWPHTMLATSTHDSKRSEDVRARINVLSEMPAGWRLALRRWRHINRRKKKSVDGQPAPSSNDEYLLYQTLLGAWPPGPFDQAGLDAFRARIQGYMLKAVREAKVHTSWINPNEEYEQALASFVDALLGSLERNPFLNDFLPAQTRIARYGMFNSLSQVLIKLTSPGVPDIYQGNELWDFSLVDPDNRRPVDYAKRISLLQSLQALFSAEDTQWASCARGLLDTMEDGRVKLYITWRALSIRARYSELFEEGKYVPLAAVGALSDHVCAFAQTHQDHTVITVAPRLFFRLTDGSGELPLGPGVWGDTRLEMPIGATAYRDVLTGAFRVTEQSEGQLFLRLATVLASFPVALLVATGAG